MNEMTGLRQTTQLLFGILSVLFLGAAAPVAGSISLEHILAPVPEPEPAPVVASVDKAAAADSSEEGGRQPETISLSLEAVVERIEELAAREVAERGELELSAGGKWESFLIEGDKAWDIRLKNSFSPDMRGRWYASFDILVDGEPRESRHLKIEASLFEEVWLVQQKLARGEIPAKASLRAVTRDVFRERGSPIPVSEGLSRYELRRTLPEGRLLTWDDLTERPAVRRGDVVQIRVEQGALQVTVRGRSLEDGLIGDTVAVKNISSHRELLAKVTGPDEVTFIP